MHLKDLSVKGKKVLVRVDFNVTMKEGQVTDATRIKAALPTINYLLAEGATVILMSHLGRPKGKIDPCYTLAPCAKKLEELLEKPVVFIPDCVGIRVETVLRQLKPGSVALLENLRFNPAEEDPKKDPEFAKQLASLADIYVNDAFGTAHRAHSSTATIASFFPEDQKAAGFLLEKEIEFLGKHIHHPTHPFYALVGGAKVSTKLGILLSMLDKVDAFFIGGGMAYTFLHTRGISIGNSLFEPELVEKAAQFLEEASKRNIPVYLPEDIVITQEFSADAQTKVVDTSDGIPDDWEGVDIGPKTRASWIEQLQKASLILWNGPFGVFEVPPFAKGTETIAKGLATVSATTIVGGGDSVAAINQLGLADHFTHISTGGGASLEYIEHGTLPGIEALYHDTK